MAQILPPFENEKDTETVNIRLPRALVRRFDAVVERTKAADPNGKGYSRNRVFRHALFWAIEELEKEEARQAEKKKK